MRFLSTLSNGHPIPGSLYVKILGMADIAPTAEAAQSGRPQKPDEAKYKADLAKAEKAHEAAQARFVCIACQSQISANNPRKLLETRSTRLEAPAKAPLATIASLNSSPNRRKSGRSSLRTSLPSPANRKSSRATTLRSRSSLPSKKMLELALASSQPMRSTTKFLRWRSRSILEP